MIWRNFEKLTCTKHRWGRRCAKPCPPPSPYSTPRGKVEDRNSQEWPVTRLQERNRQIRRGQASQHTPRKHHWAASEQTLQYTSEKKAGQRGLLKPVIRLAADWNARSRASQTAYLWQYQHKGIQPTGDSQTATEPIPFSRVGRQPSFLEWCQKNQDG